MTTLCLSTVVPCPFRAQCANLFPATSSDVRCQAVRLRRIHRCPRREIFNGIVTANAEIRIRWHAQHADSRGVEARLSEAKADCGGDVAGADHGGGAGGARGVRVVTGAHDAAESGGACAICQRDGQHRVFARRHGDGFSYASFSRRPARSVAHACVPGAGGGIFKISGIRTVASLYGVLTLNILCSVAACVPIFWIGRRVGGVATGALAAWMWAVLPTAIIIPYQWVWDTSLAALLVALSRRRRFRPRRRGACGIGAATDCCGDSR